MGWVEGWEEGLWDGLLAGCLEGCEEGCDEGGPKVGLTVGCCTIVMMSMRRTRWLRRSATYSTPADWSMARPVGAKR